MLKLQLDMFFQSCFTHINITNSVATAKLLITSLHYSTVLRNPNVCFMLISKMFWQDLAYTKKQRNADYIETAF